MVYCGVRPVARRRGARARTRGVVDVRRPARPALRRHPRRPSRRPPDRATGRPAPARTAPTGRPGADGPGPRPTGIAWLAAPARPDLATGAAAGRRLRPGHVRPAG